MQTKYVTKFSNKFSTFSYNSNKQWGKKNNNIDYEIFIAKVYIQLWGKHCQNFPQN